MVAQSLSLWADGNADAQNHLCVGSATLSSCWNVK
jgi:hypothetical protein